MMYEIPEGLSREALVDIHIEFLCMNSDIRVHARWGDYTEYSVRIRAKVASQMLGREVDGNVTWRLAFGVDEPGDDGVREHSIDVQYHDGDEWVTAVYDPVRDRLTVSAVHLITTARQYLLDHYPVAQALLAIDERLLP